MGSFFDIVMHYKEIIKIVGSRHKSIINTILPILVVKYDSKVEINFKFYDLVYVSIDTFDFSEQNRSR